MEYDSDRAGGFEPLRFVPKGKTVVLGLVTSKIRQAGIQGRAQAPHRRGGEVHRARPALPVAAMRLRLDRGGQRPGRGRAMGEAADDRRAGGARLGPVTQRTNPAIPRRSCRQPAALRRAEGGARQARERRDHADALQGDRGPRDRGADHEAGGGRAASRSPTASTAAPPGRPISSSGCPASSPTHGERKFKFQGPQPQAGADPRGRQARRLRRPPDDRALQVPEGAHQGDAEDDDPVAVGGAFPPRPRGGAGVDLSGHGRFLPRSRPDLPQGGARLRRRRLPLSAARRGQPHLSVRSEAAPAGPRPRRRSRRAAGHLCRR